MVGPSLFRAERRGADAETTDTGHGRVETRRRWYTLAGDLAPYLAETVGWQALQCVGLIERIRVTDPAKPPSVETTPWMVAGVGAIPGPWAVLGALRLHWGIENGIHYRRDVSFGEDRNHARTTALHLAAVRSFAISLHRMQGFPYTTDASAYVSAHLDTMLTWLTDPCDVTQPACAKAPLCLDTLWPVGQGPPRAQPVD